MIICLVASVDRTLASRLLEPPDTSSPYATMRSFETNAEQLAKSFSDYKRSRAVHDLRKTLDAAQRIARLFDLEPLPPATRDDVGRQSVSLMWDILNRIPEFDRQSIAGARGEPSDKLPSRWTVPGTEIRIARSETGPYAGEYQFTADTLRRLPEFHARIISEPMTQGVGVENWSQIASEITGPLVPSALVENLPSPLKIRVLDAPIWKLVTSILLLMIFFYSGLRVGARIFQKAKSGGPVLRLFGKIALPVMFGVLVALWHLINVSQIHFFGVASSAEKFISLAAIFGLTAWAAWLSVFLLVEIIIASPKISDDSYDAHLLRLLARIVSPIFAGGILVLGAADLGIPALGIVAGLGVGGIAAALAAQSTIDNVFGGLSIFADRPFRIGDFIRYAGDAGVVQSIGLRSTRILSDDGNISIVPNGHLAKIVISNVTTLEKTGVSFEVKIKSDATPQKVTTCLEALKRCALAEPAISHRAPILRVISFESKVVVIEIKVELSTSLSAEIDEIKNRLIVQFVIALQKSDVSIVSVRSLKPEGNR